MIGQLTLPKMSALVVLRSDRVVYGIGLTAAADGASAGSSPAAPTEPMAFR